MTAGPRGPMLLQGRLFSYGDTQRYRLGVNHHQIPVNAPRCPFHNYHRDGAGVATALKVLQKTR